MFLSKIINIISACGSIFLGCSSKNNINYLNNMVDVASTTTTEENSSDIYSLGNLSFYAGHFKSSDGLDSEETFYSKNFFGSKETDSTIWYRRSAFSVTFDTNSTSSGFVDGTKYYVKYNVVLDVYGNSDNIRRSLVCDDVTDNFTFRTGRNVSIIKGGFNYANIYGLEKDGSYVRDNYRVVSGSTWNFNCYIYSDSNYSTLLYDFNYNSMSWYYSNVKLICYIEAPEITNFNQTSYNLSFDCYCSSDILLVSGMSLKLALIYNVSDVVNYYYFSDLFYSGNKLNIVSSWPSTSSGDFTGKFTWVYSNLNTTYSEYTLDYSFSRPTSGGVNDISGLIFTIVQLPFFFFQNAFNITLFAGTDYAINISNLILSILGIIICFIIIKKILEML